MLPSAQYLADVGGQLLLRLVVNGGSEFRATLVVTLTMPVVTLQASVIQRRKVGSRSETWSGSARGRWEKPSSRRCRHLRARQRHALVGVMRFRSGLLRRYRPRVVPAVEPLSEI